MSQIYGYVGYNPVNGTIVVSFRGTSNFPNDVVDGDFILVNFTACPEAKVHQVKMTL